MRDILVSFWWCNSWFILSTVIINDLHLLFQFFNMVLCMHVFLWCFYSVFSAFILLFLSWQYGVFHFNFICSQECAGISIYTQEQAAQYLETKVQYSCLLLALKNWWHWFFREVLAELLLRLVETGRWQADNGQFKAGYLMSRRNISIWWVVSLGG